MAVPHGLSFEEYWLAVQHQSSHTIQSPQDPNRPYFSNYVVDGTPIYSLPFQYDEHGKPIYLPAPEAYQFINGFIPPLPGQPSNQQGKPFQGKPSVQQGYAFNPQGQPFQGQPLAQPGYAYDPQGQPLQGQPTVQQGLFYGPQGQPYNPQGQNLQA